MAQERKRGLILGTVLQGGIKVNSTIRLSPAPSAFPNQDLTVRTFTAGWRLGPRLGLATVT
jgi:hypothetical protein